MLDPGDVNDLKFFNIKSLLKISAVKNTCIRLQIPTNNVISRENRHYSLVASKRMPAKIDLHSVYKIVFTMLYYYNN